MSNLIRLNQATPAEQALQMSDALAAVFLTTLGLSGSALARTEQQRVLICYLLEHDQGVLGSGAGGFDLNALPWNPYSFVQDKQFLRLILVGVRQKIGWETLSYHPREDLLWPCLERFERLLLPLQVENLNQEAIQDWQKQVRPDEPMLHGFPCCARHGLLLTRYGCLACSDAEALRA